MVLRRRQVDPEAGWLLCIQDDFSLLYSMRKPYFSIMARISLSLRIVSESIYRSSECKSFLVSIIIDCVRERHFTFLEGEKRGKSCVNKSSSLAGWKKETRS